MTPFDFQLRTRIVFGEQTVERVGAIAGEMGARRALVVSDPGIVAAGHADSALRSLAAAGIETHLFTDLRENPTNVDVERGVALARRYEPELLLGLGGGSSMDCAKGINFVYSNGGQISDYKGIGKALRPMLPMIAVPTTAGTGSETQSFALISDAKTHMKMACGDKKASFRVAILDPLLTVTQPPKVTSLTGIDAVAHAIETYVTTKRNLSSLHFSREAWRLLSTHFSRVLDNPLDVSARAAMQLGACFAGVAIENSMLGGAHALANPLTAAYGIVHGHAVALMLPHVIRFNAPVADRWYGELLEAGQGGWDSAGASTAAAAAPLNWSEVVDFPTTATASERLARVVEWLVRRAGLAGTLRECGVEPGRFAEMAQQAAQQWTGTFNPRPLDVASLEQLYRNAF